MSSAGQIFRETVFRFDKTSAGSDSVTFDVENDGVLMAIERLSGSATITGSLKSELPDDMTDIEHDSFTIDSGVVERIAAVTHRRAKIELTWDAACVFKIAVKMVSGRAVNNIREVDIVNTFDITSDGTSESILVAGLKNGSFQLSWDDIDAFNATAIMQGSNDNINWNDFGGNIGGIVIEDTPGSQIWEFKEFTTYRIRLSYQANSVSTGTASYVFIGKTN